VSRSDAPTPIPALDLETARRLALVALYTQSAVTIGDGQGFVEWVNGAFTQLTGYGAQQVIGKPIPEALFPGNVDDVAVGRLRAHLARGEPAKLELRVERRSGKPRRLAVEVQPVRDAGGRPVRFVVLASDISAQRAAQHEERRLREEALEALRRESLQAFAGGVARRLDPWLTSLVEHTDLALGELPAEAAALKWLSELRRVRLRARSLTERMRTIAGQHRIAARSVDLSEAVVGCSPELDRLSERRETLNFDLSAKLPTIRADVSQLYNLLLNLVGNAFEALGDQHGTVRVRTGTRRVDEAILTESRPKGSLTADQCVFLEVSDSGCGMDPALRARIFDPFFTTKSSGRGLGLAGVLGIVQAHRGGLLVESEPGEGTTVSVLFPCSRKARRRASRLRLTPRRSVRPRRVVLLMEDDPPLRDRAQRALRRSGFRVLTADSGPEGLERFRQYAAEIDAVLLAPVLPGPCGDETVRRMRLIRPDVRFVLASPYHDETLEDELAEGEVARFLQKPYSGRELVDTVRSVLSG
jgi:PAS domain S-box-containing protein